LGVLEWKAIKRRGSMKERLQKKSPLDPDPKVGRTRRIRTITRKGNKDPEEETFWGK